MRVEDGVDGEDREDRRAKEGLGRVGEERGAEEDEDDV